MIIPVCLGEKSYDIILERGVLSHVGERINRSGRRVCVVTDDGVPQQFAERVMAQLEGETLLFMFPQGEQNKQFETYLALQKVMLDAHLTRADAVVAIGGGVVGDLAGFAAATYMRGIDFYNIPTTILSQVDSSIGGKTAVDFAGYKNMIGAFWQPKAVWIDPDVLLTLPPRQVANGLAEAVKMAVTSDETLFSLFEEHTILPQTGDSVAGVTLADVATEETLSLLEQVIARCLIVKKDVVEQDEKEAGLRRVLNFGHTLGHAIETCMGLSSLYHGECVALGMLPMCGEAIRPRVSAVLSSLGLPTALPEGMISDVGALESAILHDKKSMGTSIKAVISEKIGSFDFVSMTAHEIVERM